ncbi:MAG: ATP-binding protein [Candidatus Omnitrophica bacterium]|nr:ATP-binding protein [Candidatus Omnitrophota bacterium]
MIDTEVETSLFSGREEILARLEQRLEALKKGYRQNVGLVGPRFIGKTFILCEFLHRIRKDPEIIPVYISLTPSDFEGLVERWLGSLLQGFLASQNISFPEEFQLLVKISRTYIPKTLEKMREVKKHTFQKRTAVAFRELLSLTASLREETGKKIVLILDEFQSLGALDLTDPFGLFGKEMMIQKDTFYLATSSEPHRAREIFHERLSLLFGNFEVIEVDPFDSATLHKWMAVRFPEIQMPDSDFRLLSYLFNNHPFYIDLFLEAARLHSLKKNISVWSREMMLETIQESLFSERGFLNQHFESEIQSLVRLGRHPRPFVKILLAVANGRVKLLQIAAYAGKKGPETKKMLQRLMGEGMVEKRGSFYLLPDPLFRFWLRNVFQLKDRELGPDNIKARAYFESRLLDEVRKIEEEDRKDLTERVESLFREFRNDIAEINEKKIMCPTFLEIASRPTNGRFFPMLGRAVKGRWVCQVFRDSVTETDVTSFVDELKHFRKKIQRKIMVTLGGIDLNAKLIAQEAKIQIWDLKNLNSLLDLYGKLKIIPQ